MQLEEAKDLVATDPTFIWGPRFGNQIEALEARYLVEDTCPDHVIAAVLLMSVEELQARFEAIVVRLREHMGVVLD